MPQKKTKLKTIKTPIGPIWVYSSVERAVRPLKKKNNLKIITAVGAVIIILITLLYAGFINDKHGSKAFSGSGTGTTLDPFQIANCSQLQEMQQSLTSHYALVSDIDCSASSSWNSNTGFIPVGQNSSNPFSGSLDGRNLRISNLYINKSSGTSNAHSGLFGYTNSALIKNIVFTKPSIIGCPVTNCGYTGVVVGVASNATTVRQVNASGSVNGAGSGGLIGSLLQNSQLDQSSYSGTVSSTGGQVGGLVGMIVESSSAYQSSITNSYANAVLTGDKAGGLVADLQYGKVSNSYAHGSISTNNGYGWGDTGGGLIASMSNTGTVVENSFAATQITTSGAPSYKGGLVGRAENLDAGAISGRNNFFDVSRTTATECVSNVAAQCTSVNISSGSPNYFFGNSAATPLNTWDFNVVWKTTLGGYPTLRTTPSVTTGAATDLTQNLATLNGTQWSTLNTATTARGFQWGNDTSYGNTVNLTPNSPSSFTLASNTTGTGLNRPQDIAQDLSGNIYVTDSRYTTNNIKKYDVNGNLLGTIGNPIDQNWTGSRDGDLRAPNGIAIDTSGNIYVADTNNNRIQKFDANGTFITKWGSDGSGNGQFNGPNSIAIDSGGNVYVTDSNNNRVQKFDANGTFITKWGSSGSGNGQFNVPRGITYDNFLDRILVVDTFNSRIQEFTTTGTYHSQWGSYGSGNKQFGYPQKINFSPISGSIYVTDSAGTSLGNQRVQEFIYSNRAFNNQWGTYGNGDGEFIFVSGIIYNNTNDKIYTVDFYNSRVQVFDDTGNYQTQFGNTAFSAPDAVYVDNLNNMYVQNDQLSSGIQKFDAYGNYKYTIDQDWAQDDVAFDGLNNAYVVGTGGVRKYSATGELLNTWSFPNSPGFNISIEVDSQGNIYTGDTYNFVQKFDSNFNLIQSWGSYGTSNGQFYGIGDMVVDSYDNIFIIDYDNPRIQKFSSDGSYITKWGSSGGGNNQFSSSNVNHLAVDSNNNIYVQDAINARVQKFSNAGSYITQFGSVGPGDMQFWSPWGIAINSYDQVVIADLGSVSIKTFNQPATFNPEGFASTLTNLTCGTTYHYRSFATNGDGTSYGNDVSFTTDACSSTGLEVATLSSSNISSSAATLHGSITSTGGSPLISRGIQYGKTTNYGSMLSEPATSQLQFEQSISEWGDQDGQLQSPHIAIAPTGDIYTVEWYNTRVQKLDANGNHLLTWGSPGSGPGQFGDLREIAVDTNGYVYVVDALNHRIQKFDSNGNFIAIIGIYGSGNGQFSTPYSIAFDEANNMYVADSGNNRIQKFDSNGNYLLQWGNFGTGVGQFYGLNDVSYRDGIIATAEWEGARVQTFDTNGNPLNHWGDTGSEAGQFTGLNGVAFAPDGSIYTSEFSKQVQRFSPDGDSLLLHSFTEHSEISALNDIEVDSNGYVYAVNYGDAIIKYSLESPPFTMGSYSLTASSLECGTTYHYRAFAVDWNSTGYGDDATFTTVGCTPQVTTLEPSDIDADSATFSGLVSPRWLASRGFQWSTDPNFNTGTDLDIDSTPPAYTEAESWGEYGSGYGQNLGLLAIEHDASDNAYTLDMNNCKVSKFDSSGGILSEWGSCGSAPGQFNSPRAMGIDSYNNIYVVDTYNHRIQKFDSEGNYILDWGSQGSGDGQFSYVGPRGIAIDASNNVYISDINANRIQKFDSNGNYLLQWGSAGTGNGQFSGAWHIAIDSANNVYVYDINNYRIQKFDSNGNYLLQWGSAGTGNGQFTEIAGIETDSQDNLYTTDNTDNRIQRFNSYGNYIDSWGSTGNGTNQLINASDISFDRSDNAYVVNMYSNDPIKKFSYGISLTTADSLLCDTNYYVRAFSTTSNDVLGGVGQTVSFATSACAVTPPGPPENLSIDNADGTNATLHWSAPSNQGSSPVTDYLIEFRSANDSDWTPYPNTVSPNTYEDITGLNPATHYYFRVYAVSNDGVSEPSNEAELSYEIDVSINTTLLNSGEVKAGDTITYRNTLTNNGPGTTTLQNVIPASLHIIPTNFTFSTTNSSSVACADWNSSEFDYLAQFYPTSKIAVCLPTTNITLEQGESLTYDIIGTANSSYPTGASFKSFGINFMDAHREKVEFDNQFEVLSGIFMAFGGDFSQPSSSTDIYTLPFNNISISTYNYTAPSSTPTPNPTVTTNTTPSPSIAPSPSPSSNPSPSPSPSPTNQPEPKLPNPLFPKYPPEGVKIPKADTPPVTVESNFLTGFIPAGVLNTIRMTPNAVALALPFFIILVLIALAVLYARQAWLEYRTIAKVRGIIERYHSTKEASQNFVALTSHYLNTPVNILQASVELLASTKAVPQTNINKLNLAIKNLADDIRKLVTESQKTTSRVAESTTELDKLRLKNPLLSIFVVVPSGIVVLILFILNLLFTATDRYSLSFALIVAQITALVLGIGLLALSWHSYKRNQASHDALKHQLTLEADILARRVAFITQSYSDLNADLGLVKALTKDIPKTDPAQKTLQNGSTMLEDVLKKFGRLINFSRPLEVLPVPISIAPVIESALNAQKNAVSDKKITVTSQVPVNITAPLTQEAIEQLINSIVDNAVKFNKDGGSLKVYTKNTKRGTTITFEDSGIGIDTAKLSQLMTPFSRATDVLKFDYEGIGLNLYLDKVLLEQIGGELRITSTQKKGTTVTLTLPGVKQ